MIYHNLVFFWGGIIGFSPWICVEKKSVERPELTAPITTEDGRLGHKRMSFQMLQKRQNGTKKIESKKKKKYEV